jgi:hypothetical protein
MKGTFLTRAGLRKLLVQNGQIPPENSERGTEVCPTPEAIITVALNLDPFHDPACRERYFVTLLDPEDDKPLLRSRPAFVLPEPFATALDREPIGGRQMRGNFLLGPFRWLVRRLVRFPRLLVWPENQIRASDGFVTDPWALDEMPELEGWLQRGGTVPSDVGAIVLDPADVTDCRVLWEIAEQVEASFYNYFVSDPDASEVYMLHHHSKILASILESSEHERLLDELSSHADVLEDCSGSILDWGDDEFFEET